MLLVLALLLLGVMGLRAFSGPFNQDSRDSFWMVAIYLAAPMALLAINMLRRRTVLSARGIEMRRLLWTERRPWPATPSGLTLSAHMLNGRVGGNRIEWYRLALVDGMPGELVRLPGCVFTGIGRFNRDVSDQARMALKDIWEYAQRQGWIVSDPRAVAVDPRLVEAQAAASAGSAGAASRPLAYRAPAWRRIWEYLCDRGLFLVCLGAFLIMLGVTFLVAPGPETPSAFHAVLLLLGALVTLGWAARRLSPYLRATVVDREGIRAGGKRLEWPQSRSDLYVAGGQVVMVSYDCYTCPLSGTGGLHPDLERREAVAAAQCEEIWRWGLAHGVVVGGHYVRLRQADAQREREIFEARAGMARRR
ncbi:hypothetical protein HMPREF1318_1566 [Actinomyces massiliensis F0489]|uniref:Uncharacterized protein n=1 Tax=Actinomyces massiliensis F0489 TaxID=1125718 RepID=J0XF99_9ACTO|nr:hypothetical protein HMPREF1318_1566 [Actinomyces massiliensis F0489]